MHRVLLYLLVSLALLLEPGTVSFSAEGIKWSCEDQKREALYDYVGGEDSRNIVDSAMYAASAFNLDPSLLIAVAEVESRFDRSAVSPAGAVGLAQIMPATEKLLKRKYAIPGSSRDVLSAMLLAAAHIYESYSKYGQNLDLALIEYNGGSRVLRRYLRTGKLPRETLSYVRKVKEVYNKLLWRSTVCDLSYA